MEEERLLKHIELTYPNLNENTKYILFSLFRECLERDENNYIGIYFILKLFSNVTLSSGNGGVDIIYEKYAITSILPGIPIVVTTAIEKLDPGSFFKKNKQWKTIKNNVLESFNSSKKCIQCNEIKKCIMFSHECKAVCMSCPKNLPKSTKENSTVDWVKSLMGRVKTIESNPDELGKLITEITQRKNDLLRVGVKVDDILSQLNVNV